MGSVAPRIARGFVVVQLAEIFGEKGQPVAAREQHVHRQIDAQQARHFGQLGAQFAGQAASGSGLGEVRLSASTHTSAARGTCSAVPTGGGFARLQAADELFPRVGIPQRLAGHFHEYSVLREPEIGRRGGQDIVLFVHLAGQRFRFHARLHHGGGFSRAGFAQQNHRRQLGDFGILLLLRHRQPRFGLGQQFVQIGHFLRPLRPPRRCRRPDFFCPLA